MTDKVVQEIRESLEAATPGPWKWAGNTKGKDIFLAGNYGDTPFIMGFERWGMRGAQPVFRGEHVMEKSEKYIEYERPYRFDISGINHPDANLIANAPEWLSYLLTELDAAKQDKDEIQADIAVLKFAHKEEVRHRQQQLKQAIHPIKEAHRLLELHRTAEAHATLTAAMFTLVQEVEKETTHEK